MTKLDIDTSSVKASADSVDSIASDLHSALSTLTTEDCSSGFLPESKAAHPTLVAALTGKNAAYTSMLTELADNLRNAANTYGTTDTTNADALDIPSPTGPDTPGLNL